MKRVISFAVLAILAIVAPWLCFGACPQGGDGKNSEILVWVSEMPKFNGGNIEVFRKWVQDRVRRPSELKKEDVAGRVVVSFVVECDGSISNVQILQSPHQLLSDEVVRVVKSSAKWTPGRHEGVLKRVRYNMPVDFRFTKLKSYVVKVNNPDAKTEEGLVTIRLKTKKDSLEIKRRRESYAEHQRGFGSMVDLSCVLGMVGKPRISAGVNYIAGYRFNNQLYLGGGVGITLNSHSGPYDLRTYDGYRHTPGGSLNTCFVSVPLFAYFRANFINRRLSPFFALSAGGNLTAKQTIRLNFADVKTSVNRAFLNPQVGVNFRAATNYSVYLAVGFYGFITPYCTEYTGYSATIRNGAGYGFDFHLGFTF